MTNTFRINDNLTISGEFKDFILATNHCRVTAVITSFQTSPDVNFLDITDKIDTVSYLPASKIEAVLGNDIDPYSDNIGRISIKIGRLISKLFPKNLIEQYISPSDIEQFVNLYKSFFDTSNQKIEIVSGEDIRKYYLDRNYSTLSTGNLWKSCMRHSERQEFLDIYVNNPDKIKMLVLFNNENGVDKVKGRALLWEDVSDKNGNHLKVMDRIYTVFDSDVHLFKRWARDNGYITKYYQNAKSQNIYDINGVETRMDLTVNIDSHKFFYYPYLDSFQFYNTTTGDFHNNPYSNFEYTLIQANGSLTNEEESDDGEDDSEDDSWSLNFPDYPDEDDISSLVDELNL